MNYNQSSTVSGGIYIPTHTGVSPQNMVIGSGGGSGDDSTDGASGFSTPTRTGASAQNTAFGSGSISSSSSGGSSDGGSGDNSSDGSDGGGNSDWATPPYLAGEKAQRCAPGPV
jgi:hypothetical protein